MALDHSAFDASGVYVIWHGGPQPKTVYVGQGDPVRDRLSFHRSNPKITAYAQHGLYVIWASVNATLRDGVEHYLANQLSPLVGEAHPSAAPIAVNLPW